MRLFKKWSVGILTLLMLASITPVLAQNSNDVEILAEDEVLTPVQQEEDFTNPNEVQTNINMVGMLVEIGSTDVPTTMIIRNNADHVDYTVNIGENTILGQRRDQYTHLSDWIPGDQIRVIGLRNENTSVIDANIVADLSISLVTNSGLNGWIDSIDAEDSIVGVQWNGKIIKTKITDHTHIVAGLKNPAMLTDLHIGDRVRGRLIRRAGSDVLDAKILVVLRRGRNLFMKVRTWVTRGELVALDNTATPTQIQVKILRNKNLRAGDVNNLVGQEGDVRTVNVSEDTKLVSYKASKFILKNMIIGDRLLIVGRANDMGEIDARIIKDNTIRVVSTQGYAGTIVHLNPKTKSASIFWQGGVYRVDLNHARILNAIDGDKSVLDFSDLHVGDRVRGRGVKNAHLPIIDARLLVVVKNKKYTFGHNIKLERKVITTPEGTVKVNVEVNANDDSASITDVQTSADGTTVDVSANAQGTTTTSDNGTVTTSDASANNSVTTNIGDGIDTSVTTNATTVANTEGNGV